MTQRPKTPFTPRASRGVVVSAALVASVIALLLAPAAQASIRAKIGEFGTPAGSGKGQLEHPGGVAVNITGAGGVSPGDVYVVDSGVTNHDAPENNRIVEFSATGEFVRAWGIDVVASGPDNISSGAFEVCEAPDECKAGLESAAAGGMDKPEGIAVDQVTGNVYVIDANGNSFVTNSRVNVYSAKGAFEGSFGWGVNASTPEEKLQFCTTATGCQKGTRGGGAGQLNRSPRGLPAIDPGTGDLVVPEGGESEEGNFRIEEFEPQLNGAEEVTGVKAVKAIGWDVVKSGPDQSSEVQQVTVNAASGKFTLSFKAEATGELEFDASDEEVEDALNALPAINTGGGSVKVTPGPRDGTGAFHTYLVDFDGGPLHQSDVPLLTAAKAGLSGGSPKTELSAIAYSEAGLGLEVCLPAVDECKAAIEARQLEGAPNEHLGQFDSTNPTSVAVDAAGSLYVVDQSSDAIDTPGRVFKFSFPAAGEAVATEFAPEFLTQRSSAENDGNLRAVDPTDVAVDPATQHILVAKKEGEDAFKFLEFDSAGTKLGDAAAGVLAATHSFGAHGLAIGTGERFYFTNPLGEVDVFGPAPPPGAQIEPPEEVGATTATFRGKVTPVTGIQTTYHFESSQNGTDWVPFPTTDVAVGDGSGAGDPAECPTGNAPVCEVSQKATGLEPNADYLVRLVATNGTAATSAAEAFKTEAAPPGITDELAKEITQTSATLSGLVNPGNQATTYRFEWGETPAYGNEVPLPEGAAGSGGEALEVKAPLEGLKEGAAYHFRIDAANASGESKGPDHEFTTLDRWLLAEARAPEQVSPNEKRPVGSVYQSRQVQIRFQAAADGQSVVYPLQNGTADATAGGDLQYLGERGQTGWASSQLTPPSLVSGGGGVFGEATGRVLYASPDLSCELIESFEPLTQDTPAEDVAQAIKNLYRRERDGTYTLLSTPVPLERGSEDQSYRVDGVSADCKHVLFDSNYKLLEEASAVSGPPHRDLYEYEEGAPLRLAGILPDGSVASGVLEGAGGNARGGAGIELTSWNSLSADGSKAFFTAISDAGADKGRVAIFMRVDGAETVDASQSETAVADQEAHYALASADGSHVFFTANYGLAAGGSSTGAASCDSTGNAGNGTGAGCDLYAYDAETRTLTDLSADANPADAKGAGAVGVLDASDDGSRVYFAARGQLLPGQGRSEAQNLSEATYNVYLSEEGSLSYVGPIAATDTTQQGAAAESGSDLSFGMVHWVADATPDGSHLLFVSKADVSGYESGGVSEAYLYSAQSGQTVCVSCRQDGQPSTGGPLTQPVKTQARAGAFGAAIVQNRPRSISDDGRRVFFTMPDVLAPGARAGTHNVYEWSGGQVYLLVAGEETERDPTEFVDSSASGDDAFVVTRAKLVRQDFDTTPDLYDLRAGGGLPEPGPPTAPCDPLVGQCQEPPRPQPAEAPAAPSEGFQGAGNPPLKPAAKRHGKHRRGHHRKARHHKAKHHNRRRSAR